MYALDLLILEHENISRMTHVMRNACLQILEFEAANAKERDYQLAVLKELEAKYGR